MSTEADAARMRPPSAAVRLVRGMRQRLAGGPISERHRFVLLIVLTTAIGLAQMRWSTQLPRSVFLPVVLIVGLFLRPALLLIAYAYVLAWMALGIVLDANNRSTASAALVALGLCMAVMYPLSRSRAALGVYGNRGDRMLLDLRDRHRFMARMPQLPPGWRAESFVAAANGDSFSGDFLISHATPSIGRLEFVLADVSGKGHRAGTRSMLLSGALTALIGQVEPDQYLPAANSYLVRSHWREGFASAAYLVLDTTSGEFSVRSAGHPPVIQFHHETGEWTPMSARGGPVLGVMDGMTFPSTSGHLDRGDALLLYTDGVVESRDARLDDGIDWMLGAVERSRRAGFDGVAATLCGGARCGNADDRAVLVVWRP